jgi:hypothetical protein
VLQISLDVIFASGADARNNRKSIGSIGIREIIRSSLTSLGDEQHRLKSASMRELFASGSGRQWSSPGMKRDDEDIGLVVVSYRLKNVEVCIFSSLVIKYFLWRPESVVSA